MNQMTESGDSKYEYDKNGNLIKEMKKKQNEIAYFEYSDEGKLKKALNLNNQNCSYFYNCLEQLRSISCTETGNYTLRYHANALFKDPFSLTMPNGTSIYFVTLPYSTLITAILHDNSQTAYTPIYVNTNRLLTSYDKQQKSLFDSTIPLTSTGNGIELTVNLDKMYLISRKNKLISLGHQVKLSPDKIFSTEIHTLNTNAYKYLDEDLNFQIELAYNALYRLLNSRIYESSSKFAFEFSQLGPIKPTILSKLSYTYIFFYPTFEDLFWCDASFCNSENFYNRNSSIRHERFQNKRVKIRRAIPLGAIPGICKSLAAGIDTLSKTGSLSEALMAAGDVHLPFPFLKHVHHYRTSDSINYKEAFQDAGSSLILRQVKGQPANRPKRFVPAVIIVGGGMCALGVIDYVLDSKIDQILSDILGLIWDLLSQQFFWALSLDPNDIAGPEAYGSEQFVAKLERFKFKIRYENMANTTAPAQLVKIVSKVDNLFDLRSVNFLSFGFNTLAKHLNEKDDSAISKKKTGYISQAVKYQELFDSDRYEVKVFAAVDPSKRELVWQFKTIDIKTGKYF
jgi:hypothetical protein